MSTWAEGKTYDYYGRPLVCARRFFVGQTELVALHWPAVAPALPEPFIRTARALAPCVLPIVTETLGGVTHPETCHHDWYPTLTASGGPNDGLRCCSGCGGAA